MSTSLLIFTLNEIDGMRVIMPQIKKEWYSQLLVIDGGSTDGTIEYCRENGYDIHIQSGKGTANAFKEGWERMTGDIVVVLSPDGNSIPGAIPALAESVKAYDIIIASRYGKGCKSEDDDIVTAFGNWMFTTMFNLLYRTKITDLLVMYRAYNKARIDQLGLDFPNDAWGTRILCHAARKDYFIGEVPFDEPKRIGGVRKMNPLINGWYELITLVSQWR